MWWWIGWQDTSRPVGQRSLGVFVFQHLGGFHSAANWAIGFLAPDHGELATAEAVGGSVATSLGDPPIDYTRRLLNSAEAAELAEKWGGGVASPDDVRDAADNPGAVGAPLFRRGKHLFRAGE